MSLTVNVFFNPGLKLNNILWVTSFNLNMLSISKLTNDLKCCVTFYLDSCVMQDLVTVKMIGSGKQFGSLYHISSSSIKSYRHQGISISRFVAFTSRSFYFSRFKFLVDKLHVNKRHIKNEVSER